MYSGFFYIIGLSKKFGKYFASFFGVPYLNTVTVTNGLLVGAEGLKNITLLSLET